MSAPNALEKATAHLGNGLRFKAVDPYYLLFHAQAYQIILMVVPFNSVPFPSLQMEIP
jgi:hypothetical protein